MRYNFLNEDIKINNSSGSDNSSSSGTGGNPYAVRGKKESDLKPSNDDIKSMRDEGHSEEEIKNFKTNISNSMNMMSGILGAKITFGENCYKDYMKIIRAHVRHYARNEANNSSDNNKEAEKNTDIPEKAKPAE